MVQGTTWHYVLLFLYMMNVRPLFILRREQRLGEFNRNVLRMEGESNSRVGKTGQ
jgi:hypothetical protein